MRLIRRNAYLLGGLLLVGPTLARAADFDFKDPKSVNSVQFLLDSEVEPIMGLASGITGTISFDPAAPDKTSGSITVDATSIHMMNEKMQETVHQGDWLDTKKNGEVKFEFKKVTASKKTGDNSFELTVTGDFTLKGVKKEMSVVVRATYLPGKAGARLQGKKGDLLVLRSDFTIKRSDFGIKPGMMANVVAEEINIKVSITGMHPEK